MSANILIIEDDQHLATAVRRYLERAGYHTSVAHDGRRGLDLARQRRPDLVILDIMLPVVDGWDVCRILRAESDVPIIMATARSTEDDTLLGLDLGADDYVTKPFSPRELVGRVRAVLRRARPDTERPVVLEVPGLVVDAGRHEVHVDGSPVHLTPTEFAILAALGREPGRVWRRSELTTSVFGWDHDGSERTLDVHILNLRRKLGESAEQPRFVETVRGVGYRLVDNDP